ncbi:MAG: cytochrome-c oxidase, cbb3-type subunit III [Alphaproteobacteria bacterium]|jgi:cytochrome c oxidase cbb3-type subunit 3|nr:cytochrome-c oxidase, cbb3-type subunit III [Alphaproteobacteria bacterium]
MPTKVEKDSITGTETTGHEWDGIKELNTPLPKWWVYVFYVTIVFAVVYSLLYPSVPGIGGYFEGVIGYSQRDILDRQVAEARAAQGQYYDRLEQMSPAAIIDDPDMFRFAFAGGEAAFADNCAPCHGQGGAGVQGGFPVLADDAWIWGGTLDAIHYTLLYGIRHDNPDSRTSIMPTFGGEFALLSRDEIGDVADYVLSLSGQEHNAERAGRGAEIFAQQCVACHGENSTGLQEFGAPNLTDRIWLYGGERAEIIAQINQPQHGVMPAWIDRLEDTTIKMLTVYVHSLGGGE